MASFDALIFIWICAQPVALMALLFYASNSELFSNQSLQNMAARNHVNGNRYFECAVSPRLIGWLRYDVGLLAISAVFLIYDVDIVFFFSEILTPELWVWWHVVLIFLYILFLVCGLTYDMWQHGLMWSKGS